MPLPPLLLSSLPPLRLLRPPSCRAKQQSGEIDKQRHYEPEHVRRSEHGPDVAQVRVLQEKEEEEHRQDDGDRKLENALQSVLRSTMK